MTKDDIYFFHQTPAQLTAKLITEVPLVEGDYVLEPFRGEGAFYNTFPNYVNKDWCEIEDGLIFYQNDYIKTHSRFSTRLSVLFPFL